MKEVIRQLQTIREEIDNLTRLLLEEEEGTQAQAFSAVPEDAPNFYSVQDLADKFQVSPATIYRWEREGRFPKGKQWGARTRRWSKEDLEAAFHGGYSS